MKDEYVIINKTAIQKRIEELEKEVAFYTKVGALNINPNKVKAETELSLLKQILSQSTPLIPEIEKAYLDALNRGNDISFETSSFLTKEYISNLKLNT